MNVAYDAKTGVLQIFGKSSDEGGWLIRQEDIRPECWDLLWAEAGGAFGLVASCTSFGGAYARAQKL